MFHTAVNGELSHTHQARWSPWTEAFCSGPHPGAPGSPSHTHCHTSYPGCLLPSSPGKQLRPHQAGLPPSQPLAPAGITGKSVCPCQQAGASEVRDRCLLSVPRVPSRAPDPGASTQLTLTVCLVNSFTRLFLRLHNRQNS